MGSTKTFRRARCAAGPVAAVRLLGPNPKPNSTGFGADVQLHDEDEGHLLGRGEEEAAYSAPGGDEEDESGGEEKGESPPAAGRVLPLGFLLSYLCSNRSAHLRSGRGTARCTRSTAKRCGYRERICGRPSCAAANHALRWQADIPNKNPDVCASPLLKNLYGRRRAGGKSGGAGAAGHGGGRRARS